MDALVCKEILEEGQLRVRRKAAKSLRYATDQSVDLIG